MHAKSLFVHKIILALGTVLLAACAEEAPPAPRSSPSVITDYCAYLPAGRTFADPVQISGAAKYQYRDSDGYVSGTPNPIRFAEVRITDASGTLVQCDETDSNGEFSFQLPKDGGTYTISVTSRANNDSLKAYVLTNPTTNSYHSVVQSVTTAADVSGLELIASATGTLEGGAFNILDQIYRANEFLRTYASTDKGCGTDLTTCVPFTVAPLAYVYWSKGVNPATYFGIAAPLSFYIPGESKLYILGGVSGDVNSSDTDHFDNSVILHEYGHFIEDHYAGTDSPGGSHSGQYTIDPRLAWGEGWANFFQAAVTGVPEYIDTHGTRDDISFGFNFYVDIEVPTIDIPLAAGEGNFREFSITRLLWNAIDPHPVTDNGTNEVGVDDVTEEFSVLWTVFAGTTNSFRSPSSHFRSIGLFHKYQALLGGVGAKDWSSLIATEKHRPDETDYAPSLETGGACTLSLSGVSQFDENEFFHNNDFYSYHHAGGELDILLEYTPNSGAPDLDLYVYKEAYTFGNTASFLDYSNIGAPNDGYSERVTVNAPAGYYMINVNIFTLGSATYTLKLNHSTTPACPTP